MRYFLSLLGLTLLLSTRTLAADRDEVSSFSDSSTHSENQPTEKRERGVLVLQIGGLRNLQGQLLIAVFEQSTGFPDDREQALRTKVVPLGGELSTIRFEGIAHGRYAVAVVHDENENDKLDTSFVGIPREGIGVSRGTSRMLRKPSFDDAVFSFTDAEQRLIIEMIYF